MAAPPPDLDDDRAFAAALADGRTEAVQRFEAKYRPLVRHALGVAVRRFQPDAPVVPEDLVQDFVGFLFSDGGRRLRTYAGRAAFGAWVYTVALRYFQRRMAHIAADRRGDVVLHRLPDRDARGPEQAAGLAQEAERLRAAVATLSPTDQLYVRLFYVEDLDAGEVARTLGKGASAVRMRKLRILDRLRGLLGLKDEDGGADDGEAPDEVRGGER